MKNTILVSLLISLFCTYSPFSMSQDVSRWSLENKGSINWQVNGKDTHQDHIEMSGFYISAIVHYGVQTGRLKQKTQLVFPMLRTIPNDTHASLLHEIDRDQLGTIKVDGKEATEYPSSFCHRGVLECISNITHGVAVRHQWFPATDKPLFIEKIEIKNTLDRPVSIELPKVDYRHVTEADQGVQGAYEIKVESTRHGSFQLGSKETLEFAWIYSGYVAGTPSPYVSPDYELRKRMELVDNTFSNLVFESPDEILNSAFSFAKLRAVESIFNTTQGLMHGPGGGSYYAAIWANDQAEYANPLFPFLGNIAGNESAINSFRHFARFINDEYKPIPSSIIAEGLDYWNGAGDRGDMAMIAYGAARFALAYGHNNTGKELWPLVEWCLEFCRRKVTADGVVSSDSDELEGRFPAGDANLNTSCLYYDALISATFLGKELGVEQAQLDEYQEQAKRIRQSVEDYFGATIDGFKTYRYFDGNDILRAWICTPLTVDIFSRSNGTIDALFSEKLWTADGLASESGNTTFWDRATLYALRGVFAAGETKRALKFLSYYSKRRLLGEHVPYPVEAYPEGNQRHLSAESALYCRIITEGLFGIRPTGLSRFSIAPKLPEDWNEMSLRNIKAFNRDFDIEVKRDGNKLNVKVYNGKREFLNVKINEGQSIECGLQQAD